ncbi:MAG TPA: ESX secretion-associated protein EspG [Mycobacterium sp.]|nr:ESX secretion-associated protein EspG [Mycobacterium sp.]
MLTTTIDGLRVLQVLTGIEVLAPELGLRPTLPSLETVQLALTHPITDEFRAAGVLNEADEVDATVVEWLTVLTRRDIALLIRMQIPDDPARCSRALLVRFAQWWAVLERSEEFVRVSGGGTSSAEEAANAVLNAQIERLCGTIPPAPLRPVTLDVDTLLTGVTDAETLRAYLGDQRLDGDQLRILTISADPNRSTQASIVALQSGVETGAATRIHVEPSAVTIIDTPEGRLVAEQVRTAEKKWMVIAPGTATNIAAAVNQMLRRLPADQDWHSYRKAV